MEQGENTDESATITEEQADDHIKPMIEEQSEHSEWVRNILLLHFFLFFY